MLIENTKEFSDHYLIYGTPYAWHDAGAARNREGRAAAKAATS